MSPHRLSRPQALLLDAGNTVVMLDHEAVATLLAELGHALEASALRAAQRTAAGHYARLVGGGAAHEDGWQVFMRSLLEAAGIAEPEVASAVARLREAHDQRNLWRRVPEDLPDALARLRRAGIATAIVSNSEGRLEQLFTEVGLDDAFAVIVDSGIEGVRKPDPEIFWRACRRLGMAPADCLYAGDIPEIDIVGARRAGLAAALIDAHDAYPDYNDASRFDSVAALVDALLAAPARGGP